MVERWIEAVDFKNKGGWRVETQFVREMGQGYLLGIERPGEPVCNAETGLNLPKGRYRVWVRTRNWLPPHNPGRFYVLVNGQRIGPEMGTLPTQRWCWDIAGDVSVEDGDQTVSVQDTTGYFPRFAALLITDDFDYTPSPEWPMIQRERARITGRSAATRSTEVFDLVVAGAGPGGIPAAVAAARRGLKVALINARPVLGGNASEEADVGFDGAYVNHPGMREGGIAEEIRAIRDRRKVRWSDAVTILCEQQENLSIFLNQCIINAETEDGRIIAAVAQNALNGDITRYPAKMFVDATGDGWLGYYAGAAHRIGREAKWQYDEEHAPLDADGRTMSGCLMGTYKGQQMLSYYMEDVGTPSPYCAPKWAQILPPNIHRNPGRLHTGEWWVENPTDFDDMFDGELTRDMQLRLSLAYLHWLKNDYPRRDLILNHQVMMLPNYNAKRESRRIIGDYVLSENDVLSAKPFDDTVAYAGWPIDLHNQEGIFSGLSGPYDVGFGVPVSNIPFRCLYSKNISNLLVSGRCISVSHIALGTVRVENTLASVGQAAGTAAAMSLAKGVTPREIFQHHMRELQQQLLANDQYIPGLIADDCGDLALCAEVSATSVSTVEHFSMKRGVPDAPVSLALPTCLVFNGPAAAPKGGLSLFIRNKGGDTELSFNWFASPHGLERQQALSAYAVKVAAGFEGFVQLPGLAPVEQKQCGINISANAQLEAQGVKYATFKNSIASWQSPYWRAQNQYTLLHEVSGEEKGPLADCSPSHVVNGIGRPLDENRYMWVSDPAQPMPQTLTLRFPSPVSISSVQIAFDSDFINPAYSYQPVDCVPGLVRSYELLADAGGGLVKVADCSDNIFRVCRHSIALSSVSSIAVRVLSTWGGPSARVCAVKVFN